jgi:hypothetical protein
MPNNDPMLGVAFLVPIILLAIFATLFPEKEKPADGGPHESQEKGSDE